MSFRFWRRARLGPGLRINLSKAGVSLSAGNRGAHYTLGRRGHRMTLGIPGSGLFYMLNLGSGRKDSKRRGSFVPGEKLTMGFLDRLFAPRSENSFVDGCKALLQSRTDDALRSFRSAERIVDGRALAGFCAFRLGKDQEAEQHLEADTRKTRAWRDGKQV